MDTKLTLHADKHSYDNFPKVKPISYSSLLSSMLWVMNKKEGLLAAPLLTTRKKEYRCFKFRSVHAKTKHLRLKLALRLES